MHQIWKLNLSTKLKVWNEKLFSDCHPDGLLSADKSWIRDERTLGCLNFNKFRNEKCDLSWSSNKDAFLSWTFKAPRISQFVWAKELLAEKYTSLKHIWDNQTTSVKFQKVSGDVSVQDAPDRRNVLREPASLASGCHPRWTLRCGRLESYYFPFKHRRIPMEILLEDSRKRSPRSN